MMALSKVSLNCICEGCALVLAAATLLLLGIDFGGQIRTWGLIAVIVSIQALVGEKRLSYAACINRYHC